MRIFQVDAFTRYRFTGNPATVVLDAQALDDVELRNLAREFAHAEVAFVSPPAGAGHDVRIRFFNARKEMPFVGHATVAAHAVLLEAGWRGLGVCRQQSGTGVVEVAAFLDPADVDAPATIEFRQSAAQLDAPLPFKMSLRVAEALGLPGARLHESLPARVARKGGARLLLPVADAQALDELLAQMDTVSAIGRELGVDGIFAFALQRGPHGASTESRMFCPALGIDEDPVSGNAHAMLAAYLFEVGLLDLAAGGFVGRQGRQIGRPGRVLVTIEVDGSRLRAVRIGGTAVIVSEGTLRR
ncbi:MAG TPA: PhzF family phenazine biosynthesis isomerase [Steroidobacteraceae bacterium]|nr:PhzF family phenazine biosynthesis isomerase [Steroidobacteraceae bacterium]